MAGALAWFFAPRPATKARMQFAIPIEAEVTQLAVSRDGSMLAFVSPEEGTGLPALYVKRVGSGSATLLAGTEGATYPFWSPDGANIAFFANSKLQRVPAAGGPAQKIADVQAARGGSWGTQNVIIYAPDAGSAIWRVNPDGTGAAVTVCHHRSSSRRNASLACLPPGWEAFLVLGWELRKRQRRPVQRNLLLRSRREGKKAAGPLPFQRRSGFRPFVLLR